MTRAEAERELERVVRMIASDDLMQSMGRMNPWALGSVLRFGDRVRLERRRDECLKVLAQTKASDG